MSLFTDRETGPRPRTETAIDRRVERALAAMLRGFQNRDAFGIDFPSTCPDGAGYDGTDLRAFEAALAGIVPEMEGWMGTALCDDTDSDPHASTGAILDTLEWLASHVGEAVQGSWHDFFRHHHLSWDRDSGRRALREAVNTLFARNGLAYEMTEDGKILRLIEGPAAEFLSGASFLTGDASTDQLLETARRRFFDRDPDAGQHAIESLWDAFERIKTLENPGDKKSSAASLISKATRSEGAYKLIEAEMLALTNIGNDWRIRHHEVGKNELNTNSDLRDYLFLRLFELIRFLLLHR